MSDLYKNYPFIPRCRSIMLKNFKSFYGTHIIGPFLNITVILGHNGAGKSSIVEAIAFALGMNSTHKHEMYARDLIHRTSSPEISKDQDKTFVQLEFEYKENEIITLRRTILKGGTSYEINGEKLSHLMFNERLAKYRLNLSPLNFILFQGQIDLLLQSSHKSLCGIIEEICGSNELASEYSELKTELDNISMQIFEISKLLREKKEERRKAKGIKEVAEEYDKKKEEVKKFSTLKLVLQLALVECNSRSSSSNIEECKKSIDQLYEELESNSSKKKLLVKEKDISSKELEAIIKQRDILKQQRQALMGIQKGKERELTLKNSELSSHSKTFEQLQDQMEKKKNCLERLDNTLEELQNSLAKKQLEIDEIEKETNELKPETLKEYNSIKNNVESNHFNIVKELGLLNSRYLLDKNKVEDFRNENILLQKELDSKISIQSLNLKEKIIEEANTMEKERLIAHDEVLKICQKQSENQQKLQNLEKSYQEAEIEIAKLEEQNLQHSQFRKEIEAIEDFKRQCNGCYGYLYELIYANKQAYDKAIKIGLGRYLFHIVVDTNETALLCNIFLKKKHLVKDILILSNVPRLEPISREQKEKFKEFKFLYDIVEVNKSIPLLKECIQFICKRIIVCSTLDEAHVLQIKGVNKVITLDGDVLDGKMISGGMNKKLQSFSLKTSKLSQEIEIKKKAQLDIKNQIKETILNDYSNEIAQKKLNENEIIINQDNKRKQLIDLEVSRQEMDKEIICIKGKIHNNDNQIKEKEKTILKLEELINEVKISLQKIESKSYKEFCKKLKISKIDEYEEKYFNKVSKLIKDKGEIQDQINKMNHDKIDLNFEGYEQSLKEQEQKIISLKNEIQLIEKELQSRGNKLEEISDEYNKCEVSESSTSETLEQRTKEINDLTSEIQKIKDRIDLLKVRQLELSNEAKSKKSKFSEIILSANIQGIDIKVKDDGIPDFESYDIDEDLSLEELNSKIDNVNINFKRSQNELDNFNVISLVRDDVDSELVNNLKNERKDLEQRLSQLNSKETQVKKSFEKIKSERKEKFTNCFEYLMNEVNTIYQELTFNPEIEIATMGHALLYAEKSTEPFNGDIIYNVTPPGKRSVYLIDQLSGGEKSMAALALLLGIHKYRKTPFLILDEVDSFLDKANTRQLVNFIKKNNLSSKQQIIYVSHKEEVCLAADCLLGVAFKQKIGSSAVFGLDMRNQEENK